MKLDQLQRVAEAATPGPWFAADWNDDFGDDLTTVDAHQPEGPLPPGCSSIWPGGIRHIRVADTADGERPLPDAAYIAAFDPPTALRLIAIARAAKQVDWLVSTHNSAELPPNIFDGFAALRKSLEGVKL